MTDKPSKCDILINVIFGQLIAIINVTGGVFTQLTKDKYNLEIPTLQLTFMYLPLTLYMIFYIKDRVNGKPSLNILIYLVCSLIDVHATLLIVYAFEYTSITSVMLLNDSTIPFAVILSLTILKVRYLKTHYIAIGLCATGMILSLINDFFVKK